ncbi:MAG: cation diffusion facilitator family transporter [Methanomicrobiaceae archaeon]|nr:cation diffusion facilitator family transporter [Methanomicrobiaceae archaeon]
MIGHLSSMPYHRVQRTLLLILILNLAVTLIKGVFGIMAGSVSLVADALHSVFDSVSNVVGIASTEIAKRPPDRSHPYGHGRFETIGTLVIGTMLILSAYWIITEGASRLLTGAAPHITGATVGALILTIMINIFVAWYERRQGEKLGSEILIADSEHTKSDIYVSLSVLGGFIFVSMGYPQADPILAFVIGAVIGKMGLSIIRHSGDVLTDGVTVDLEDEIEAIIRETEGVIGYHQFRCRGKPRELFADIHITVNPTLSVVEGHQIGDSVRDRILEQVTEIRDIVVHVDPLGVD